MLGVSFVFEAVTWAIAMREFGRVKGELGYLQAIRASKDPPNFLVILEDSAALLGILIAAAATFGAERFHLPQLDGWGSIGIAVVLAAVALISARESKGLLLGEPVRPRVRRSILVIAKSQADVKRADLVFTVHLGPDQVLVALSIEFADSLATSDIEKNISRSRLKSNAGMVKSSPCSSNRRPQRDSVATAIACARRWRRPGNDGSCGRCISVMVPDRPKNYQGAVHNSAIRNVRCSVRSHHRQDFVGRTFVLAAFSTASSIRSPLTPVWDAVRLRAMRRSKPLSNAATTTP